jgi:hypothetical protein
MQHVKERVALGSVAVSAGLTAGGGASSPARSRSFSQAGGRRGETVIRLPSFLSSLKLCTLEITLSYVPIVFSSL